MEKDFFVVQGIDGTAAWEVPCSCRTESAVLFLAKLRATDPFQKMRDIGSDQSNVFVDSIRLRK